MSNLPSSEGDPEAPIVAAAAAWLARCDRGLDATEQDAFLQWLTEDPRHRSAFAKLETAWDALDAVAQWQPPHRAVPDPDLFAPPKSKSPRSWPIKALATGVLAASLGFLLFFLMQREASLTDTVQGVRVIPRPERQMLPDGSVAEVNHGGSFRLAYTPTERRILLLKGELHVSVAKSQTHPFLVEVDGVVVRATGTAFNVRRARDTVEVLVTEGVVEVQPHLSSGRAAAPIPVGRSEKARIDLGASATAPVVTPVSPEEIERELAWQGVRLEFDAVPLADVIAEFNLRNVQQVRMGDVATGRMRVAGTFRADQVDAFVRLLKVSYNLAVEPAADGAWVIRTAAKPSELPPAPATRRK